MSGAVPQLRFPGFEGDWEAQSLEGLCSLKSGKFVSAANIRSENEDGLYPCYGGNGVRGYVSSYNTEGIFPLIGRQGALCGNVQLAAGQFYSTEHALVATPKAGVDVSWLYQQLSRMNLNQYSTGLAQPGLSVDVLNAVQTTRPKSEVEQQKIADFLGTVDAKLDALRRKKSGLEAFKSGLMQRLFSQELRFTRDDGSEFPEWEEKTFGELVDWQSTNSLSREFLTDDPGDFQNIHYGDIHGKFPALFRQSVAAAPYITSTAPIRAPKDADFCRPGDVIFADASEDYADIGKTIEIIEVEEHSLLAGLHTHLARPKDGCFAIGFPGYLMRTEAVRHQVMQFAQGISVLGISKDNLAKVRVQVPHPDEQRKIADALSAMDAKIAADANQITHMESFKKGLLQQMFV